MIAGGQVRDRGDPAAHLERRPGGEPPRGGGATSPAGPRAVLRRAWTAGERVVRTLLLTETVRHALRGAPPLFHALFWHQHTAWDHFWAPSSMCQGYGGKRGGTWQKKKEGVTGLQSTQIGKATDSVLLRRLIPKIMWYMKGNGRFTLLK